MHTVLEALEVVLEEEVDQALGCGSYERAEDRRGYRNGAETRRVTTSVGTRELRVPRARVRDEETGETTEFRSELLPRYARRTREVDEAILGTYLSGANSRRIRKVCLRCLLLVMCTHPFAKEAFTLHLMRSEGHERYFGCN